MTVGPISPNCKPMVLEQRRGSVPAHRAPFHGSVTLALYRPRAISQASQTYGAGANIDCMKIGVMVKDNLTISFSLKNPNSHNIR